MENRGVHNVNLMRSSCGPCKLPVSQRDEKQNTTEVTATTCKLSKESFRYLRN
ncbi:GH21266 [Drosophila grimshawi]|uniref:GH21266 n=1 Tax=Drosophila grimshawi TaxID=7222 RepID=B4J7S8_DROGR|nr:GH21266 [Drosophila grimshawi]